MICPKCHGPVDEATGQIEWRFPRGLVHVGECPSKVHDATKPSVLRVGGLEGIDQDDPLVD